MGAAAEVAFQLDDANASISTFIGERHETTSLPLLDRHFRHHRHAGTCCDHRQNRCKLSALENDVGFQAGSPSSREGILAKAMAFLKAQKWIPFNLCPT